MIYCYDKKPWYALFLIVAIASMWSCSNEPVSINIRYLEKIREIRNFAIAFEEQYFWYISSFCCDQNNDLYVADSGWNKVFVFDPFGRYLKSIGNAGQGPGEFMASPGAEGLRASFGHNDYLYVLDSTNRRLIVFNTNLMPHRTFYLSSQGPLILDTPHVDSGGKIYLVAYQNDYMIQCFNEDLEWERGIMSSDLHFKKMFSGKPKKYNDFFTSEHFIRKAITKEGDLWAVSNYALHAYRFNKHGDLLQDIDISNNQYFMRDFKARIKKGGKREGRILPFNFLLDRLQNLCLAYFNGETQNWEILRYSSDGIFIDVLRVNEKVVSQMKTDYLGNYYMVNQDRTCIYQFQVKEE